MERHEFVQVMEAIEFAVWAHQHQERKYSLGPYVLHPLAVATMAERAGLGYKAAMAAVLHDVLEDCPVHYVELFIYFGREVADMVEGLSSPTDILGWKDKGLNRKARKHIDLLFLKVQDPVVKHLKLLDLTHNLTDMPASDGFLRIFVEEARLLIEVLKDGVPADVADDFYKLLDKRERDYEAHFGLKE